MKIGIVTYHRSHNYGAMLQAVALRTVLQKMGYQVFFVDYWPEHQKKRYTLFEWESFKAKGFGGKIKYLRAFFKRLLPKLQRKKNFETFFLNHIQPYCVSESSVFDVIVYGSDQIWRKQKEGYNPVYFGKDHFKTSKRISYGASMGILPTQKDDVTDIKDYVQCLDCISVRETELRQFLIGQGFSQVEEVLDPTFLLGQEEWDTIAKRTKRKTSPYLLFYEMQKDVFDKNEVMQFAKKLGLRVIYLSGSVTSYPTPSRRTTAGPYEFLNLIRHADFVITTSFHGLAFSVIYNKPFFVSFSSNSGRAKSLLDKLSLSEFLLASGQKIPESFSCADWEKVNEAKQSLALSSLSYLKLALE